MFLNVLDNFDPFGPGHAVLQALGNVKNIQQFDQLLIQGQRFPLLVLQKPIHCERHVLEKTGLATQ
jgi:hypothetical protein